MEMEMEDARSSMDKYLQLNNVEMYDDLRLTFLVDNGIILPPLRPEHNIFLSKYAFHLEPMVHQALMSRSDLELQLKFFHYEDRHINTNMPIRVCIYVNGGLFNIDCWEDKITHKPLYLKEVCQIGRNTIQIAVSACICSHMLTVHLVHRPSVRRVLLGLRNRLLTTEDCINKIKTKFNSTIWTNNIQLKNDVEEQTALKVSLICPITFKRITLPARGHDCEHVQCFDLESYLRSNGVQDHWRCPVCSKLVKLEDLEIDQYIMDILNTLTSAEVDEIKIDSQVAWEATNSSLTDIKFEEEHLYNIYVREMCAAMYTMLPDNMNMLTMNDWMMSQVSLYIPPDMSSIVSESMRSNMNHQDTLDETYEIISATDISCSNDYIGGTSPLLHPKESDTCIIS